MMALPDGLTAGLTIPFFSSGHTFMTLDIVCMGLLGLVLGSFATAVIHREPQGLSWIGAKDARKAQDEKKAGNTKLKGGSFCPQCRARLTPLDLVPLFSWLMARGRCRHCGTKIPVIYPATELTLAVLAMAVYTIMGPGLPVLAVLLALPFLWALLIIDIRHLILPNNLVLSVALLGLLWVIALAANSEDSLMVLADHLYGAVIYAGLVWGLSIVMRRILKREALGFGDVKFFAVAGLWLGLAYLPWFMMIAGAMGVILGVIWRLAVKSEVFPFGPALIIAFFTLAVIKGSLGA